MLFRSEGSEPRVSSELDLMQRNIFRCVRIIEDLLDFSRGKEVQLHPVQLDRWVALQLEEQELPDFVGLRTDLRAQATVLLDSEKFRQAFVNLLQNAYQAIALRADQNPAQGQLTIATRRHGSRVEFSVRDDGCGIRPGTADKIFKPLFSTKAFGAGLGLPLVKEIVERHHGTLEVDSEWGVGTTVTISLPLAQQEAVANGKTMISR